MFSISLENFEMLQGDFGEDELGVLFEMPFFHVSINLITICQVECVEHIPVEWEEILWMFGS